MHTYKQDYDNGKRSERECHPYIEEYFEEAITPTTSRYSKFDWYNDTKLVELKSRSSIYRERYPTTCVNKSKWDVGLRSERDVYIFVRYSDGLFFYKQDAADDGVFELKHIRNANRDRYTRGNLCVLIPVDRLTFVAHVPPPSNEVRLD